VGLLAYPTYESDTEDEDDEAQYAYELQAENAIPELVATGAEFAAELKEAEEEAAQEGAGGGAGGPSEGAEESAGSVSPAVRSLCRSLVRARLKQGAPASLLLSLLRSVAVNLGPDLPAATVRALPKSWAGVLTVAGYADVTRDEPTKILELCPVVSKLKKHGDKFVRQKLEPPGGHHVFDEPEGVCPVCGWEYDPKATLKVRLWSLDTRLKNMARNALVVQVTKVFCFGLCFKVLFTRSHFTYLTRISIYAWSISVYRVRIFIYYSLIFHRRPATGRLPATAPPA
jgi:hypothetical protein